MNTRAFIGLLLVVATAAPWAWAEEAADSAPKKPALKAQATCPVMGAPINKDLFVDVKGKRVYVCCEGCIGKIKTDPDKFLAKIKNNGEVVALAPIPLCSKCGYLKGTAQCCKKDDAGRLIKKGSDLKNLPRGAIKGASHCCNPGAGRQ